MALRQIQNHHVAPTLTATTKPDHAVAATNNLQRRPLNFKKPAVQPSTTLSRQTLGSVTNRQQAVAVQGAKRKAQASRLAVKTSIEATKLSTNGPTKPESTATRQLQIKPNTAKPPAASKTTKPAHTINPSHITHSHITGKDERTKSDVQVVGQKRQRTLTPEPMDVSEVAGSFQRKLQLVEDIDEGDEGNPQLCSEYVVEVYHYLHELESRYHPDPSYMERQTKINHKMRAILIDWLVLVQIKFDLLQETLFLTVSIIDRFLEVYPASKEQLQLIGVTSMLIASKYEEIYYPQLQDFVYITDNSYSSQEMREMERIILRSLGYILATPTPINFLRRYSKAAKVTSKVHTTAKYLMEVSQLDYSMLVHLPSQLAAASLCVAMVVNGSGGNSTTTGELWTPTLQHYSGYTHSELTPCITKLAKLLIKIPTMKQQAVREKFSNRKFLSVAKAPSLYGDAIKTLLS